MKNVANQILELVPQLCLGWALAEDRKLNHFTDFDLGWFLIRIHDFNGLKSSEVLEILGGYFPETVAGQESVVEASVRDAAETAVDEITGTIDGNEKGLTRGKSGVYHGDIVGICYRQSAHGEEVTYGGQIKKIWGLGSVQDIGLAGIRGAGAVVGLVGCRAFVPIYAWLSLRSVQILVQEDEEKEREVFGFHFHPNI